jgi:hypothetical protein
MNCLLVIAHPLNNSLCASLATHAAQQLREQGHAVEVLDLYAQGFAPALTHHEHTPSSSASAVICGSGLESARLSYATYFIAHHVVWMRANSLKSLKKSLKKRQNFSRNLNNPTVAARPWLCAGARRIRRRC